MNEEMKEIQKQEMEKQNPNKFLNVCEKQKQEIEYMINQDIED